MIGIGLSVGLIFVLGGLGFMPKGFSGEWWLVLVGAIFIGAAINSFVGKVFA